MKETLNKLIEHQLLNREEARQAMVEIASGSQNTSQIAAFLTVYMMRSVSTEELEGFRDALLDRSVIVQEAAERSLDRISQSLLRQAAEEEQAPEEVSP